jgi:hypothetical protein
MKHVGEEQLVLFYYGEPENAPEVEEHLAACETCRTDYQALQRVLNSVESLPVPERPPEYEASVWDKLTIRLGASPQRTWTLPAPRRWIRVWISAGAVAALMVAAFLAGREWRIETPSRQAEAREKMLLVAVGNHLDRSQLVLIELANADPRRAAKQGLDISYEQRTAADLLEANRLYRQTAASAGDAETADILDDLERVLLEIAHSPSVVSAGQLEDLKREIGEPGILFKVQVFGAQYTRNTL